MLVSKKNKKVYIGLSGGVDSSVSAYLLKKEGYQVTGVFIKVWQPDFLPCTWRDDRLDAMRVAAKLNILFTTLDLEREYKSSVIDYMITEYKSGRTPNPDVFCNKHVKFGAFLSWALKNGADYVATGHYARTKLSGSRFQLLAGQDGSKDQSYFLWTLTQDQLKYILFPVGHLKKTEVRMIAKKIGLITAAKKDSQGLCFISNVDMKQFLKHFIKPEKGLVLNEKEETIGTHDGAFFYTIGERHRFTITKKSSYEKPYYVIQKDIALNTITVSDKPKEKTLYTKECLVFNLIIRDKATIHRAALNNICARLRHLGELAPCAFTSKVLNSPRLNLGSGSLGLTSGSSAMIRFKKPILCSPGQSVVFYDGEVCVGGGIIN